MPVGDGLGGLRVGVCLASVARAELELADISQLGEVLKLIERAA
jgi:hypothetical protein